MRQYVKYLKEGVALANGNLHIVAVIIGVVFLTVTVSLLQRSFHSSLLSVLSLVLLLVSFSCNFTLPLVFRNFETKSKMTLRQFIRATLAAAKSLLLPLIGIGVLLILVLIIVMVILALSHLLALGALQMWQVKSQTNFLWFIFTSLIAVIPAGLFIFTSQFFALEKKGLILSARESLRASLHNPQLLLIVCLFIWVLTFFSFPLLHISPVITLLIVAIQQYFHIILYAAIYRFYTKQLQHE